MVTQAAVQEAGVCPQVMDDHLHALCPKQLLKRNVKISHCSYRPLELFNAIDQFSAIQNAKMIFFQRKKM